MVGNRIHQFSMEAGARWMLNDVAGKHIRVWDSRGHNFTTKYDALRRPIEQYVRGTFSDPDPLKPNSDPRTHDHHGGPERRRRDDPRIFKTCARFGSAMIKNARGVGGRANT